MKTKNLILTILLIAGTVKVSGQETSASAVNSIRLMTYNVRNVTGMDNVVDYRRVADVITELAPDVIALQELDSVTNRSRQTDVLLRLAELTNMHSVYGASISYDGGKYGIGILSKTQPLSWQRIPLPGREEARSLLVVEFEDYVFCCTHFSLNKEDRLASIPLINQAVKAYNKPVFLGGDLNAAPDSPILKAFHENWKELSDPRQLTFPSDKPKRTLDYLLGYNLNGYTYSVEQTGVITTEASDHLPLFSDVHFRKQSIFQ